MAQHLRRLWLTDFRSYSHAELTLPESTTAIVGRNGEGKSNLLEAVAFLAGASLRGATVDTMVRSGTDRAVLRAEASRGTRDLLLEAELSLNGRNRIQVNRQQVRRRRDLLQALTVTVFSPDDLALVKGGPSGRRRWLDTATALLVAPSEAAQHDLERIIRQRNALLKQSRGRLDEAASLTLDVWDERLTEAGERLASHRRTALERLGPVIATACRDLAGGPLPVRASYACSWEDRGLAVALADAREQDLRRGLTTVGPHRDDVEFALDELPARTHASQGEQRSLALALRLAVHRAVAEDAGNAPVLLLDDVFSELDGPRTEALVSHLPPGQTLLTTAGPLPAHTTPELVLRVEAGSVVPVGGKLQTG